MSQNTSSRTVDYYFTPQSPWTYLGHARFMRMTQAAGVQVRLRPVDFGTVFPASGGLPLGKRAPQRQAYRLVELKRFSSHLDIPLNLHPRFFPVAADAVAQIIIAVDLQDGPGAAMNFCSAVFKALWVEEKNLADQETLKALLVQCGLPLARAEEAAKPEVRALYEDYTAQAVKANVFGAPSYVLDGEIFWGQDRLEFLERALAA